MTGLQSLKHLLTYGSHYLDKTTLIHLREQMTEEVRRLNETRASLHGNEAVEEWDKIFADEVIVMTAAIKHIDTELVP